MKSIISALCVLLAIAILLVWLHSTTHIAGASVTRADRLTPDAYRSRMIAATVWGGQLSLTWQAIDIDFRSPAAGGTFEEIVRSHPALRPLGWSFGSDSEPFKEDGKRTWFASPRTLGFSRHASDMPANPTNAAGSSVRIVSMPLLLPLVLALAWPAARLFARRARARRLRGVRCRACGHALSATSDHCLGCGAAAEPLPADAGCGGCGYPIVGLASATCPECGADRAVVGIRRPRRLSRRGRFALAALAWTVAWIAAVAIAWPWLLEATPRDLSNHRDADVTPRTGYVTLAMRRIGHGWGWPAWQGRSVPPRHVTLRPSDASRWPGRTQVVTILDFDLATGQATYAATESSDGGVRILPGWAGRLDEAALERWLTLLGADPTRPETRDETVALLAWMRSPTFETDDAIESSTAFTVRRAGGGVEIVPARHGTPIVVATATLAWLLGVAAVLNPSRRRRAIAPPA